MADDDDDTIELARVAGLVRIVLDEIGFGNSFISDVSNPFVESHRGDVYAIVRDIVATRLDGFDGISQHDWLIAAGLGESAARVLLERHSREVHVNAAFVLEWLPIYAEDAYVAITRAPGSIVRGGEGFSKFDAHNSRSVWQFHGKREEIIDVFNGDAFPDDDENEEEGGDNDADDDNMVLLYHATTAHDAESISVRGISLNFSRPGRDFFRGQAFYVVTDYDLAFTFAQKRSQGPRVQGAIVVFRVSASWLAENGDLVALHNHDYEDERAHEFSMHQLTHNDDWRNHIVAVANNRHNTSVGIRCIIQGPMWCNVHHFPPVTHNPPRQQCAISCHLSANYVSQRVNLVVVINVEQSVENDNEDSDFTDDDESEDDEMTS